LRLNAESRSNIETASVAVSQYGGVSRQSSPWWLAYAASKQNCWAAECFHRDIAVGNHVQNFDAAPLRYELSRPDGHLNLAGRPTNQNILDNATM
jgi:hypothetical protein